MLMLKPWSSHMESIVVMLERLPRPALLVLFALPLLVRMVRRMDRGSKWEEGEGGLGFGVLYMDEEAGV